MESIFLYNTIINRSTGFYKEKGSKFHGYLFNAHNTESFKKELDAIKEAHPSARHFCYAYRFGAKKEIYRANDDGEPSNSAGAPILGQIQAYDLTNVAIVVVRYFGGTKLGVGGLIQAFKETAKQAIEANTIIEKEDDVFFQLDFGYDVMPFIMDKLKKGNWNITEQTFENSAVIKLSIPLSKKDLFLTTFDNEPIEIQEL
jgi:uncharacterized YigZ family protein